MASLSDTSEQSSAELLRLAAGWQREGRRVALATVIRTWGSSPRPVGSMLAVDEGCHMVGSVSGGCVEGAVVEECLAVIASGQPRILEFGVSDEQAWGVGLACGGTIRIFVERFGEPGDKLQGHLVDELLDRKRLNRGAVMALYLPKGDRALIDTGGESALAQVTTEALRRDASRWVEHEGADCLLQVFNAPLRLVVVGAVHVAQLLVSMAQFAGYAVTVVDPRTAFATETRFPGVTLVHQWPGPALEALQPDARTAVVTLTHDAKLDEPALAGALASNAFYIGALGSRKTHAARLERLAAQGIRQETLQRIHGPVGLHIGARSPGEIALSIMAEITQVLRQGRAR
ncbi:MAG: XdhC family protein [Ectothiorhodospiraceae bacterium]|nr:XdhC family protein [Ectothiorhodospiraceae bacterium]MCH8504812.1 XdhC family protein [Ectothiorhodospiraceae bacterium]